MEELEMNIETTSFSVEAASKAVGIVAWLGVAILAIMFAYYIFESATHAKVLRILGYEKAWIAWIPYVRNYGLACATSSPQDSYVTIFKGKIRLPITVYKLWWILPLALLALAPGNLGNVALGITFLMNGFFLGGSYAKIFSLVEGSSENDNATIGIVCGVFPIVAMVKFAMYDK